MKFNIGDEVVHDNWESPKYIGTIIEFLPPQQYKAKLNIPFNGRETMIWMELYLTLHKVAHNPFKVVIDWTRVKAFKIKV